MKENIAHELKVRQETQMGIRFMNFHKLCCSSTEPLPCLAEVFSPSKEKKKKPLHGSARCRPKVWTNKLTQNWFKTRCNLFEF